MISYEPFWQTIRRKNISTYQLIYEHGILPDTIQRLRCLLYTSDAADEIGAV